MGKSEKRYVTKLKANIESYCEDEEITTKEELYEKYGLPNNVVNDYFSAALSAPGRQGAPAPGQAISLLPGQAAQALQGQAAPAD